MRLEDARVWSWPHGEAAKGEVAVAPGARQCRRGDVHSETRPQVVGRIVEDEILPFQADKNDVMVRIDGLRHMVRQERVVSLDNQRPASLQLRARIVQGPAAKRRFALGRRVVRAGDRKPALGSDARQVLEARALLGVSEPQELVCAGAEAHNGLPHAEGRQNHRQRRWPAVRGAPGGAVELAAEGDIQHDRGRLVGANGATPRTSQHSERCQQKAPNAASCWI